MRVVEAKIIANRNDSIDIKFSNGMREFIASIEKENIKFENIVNNEVNVKVYSMIRNCCGASPLYILESFKSEEDDLEIADLLARFIELMRNDIKKMCEK
ncbi:MAG: hypothetical protein ACRC68_13815 [Clostridium sp.]